MTNKIDMYQAYEKYKLDAFNKEIKELNEQGCTIIQLAEFEKLSDREYFIVNGTQKGRAYESVCQDRPDIYVIYEQFHKTIGYYDLKKRYRVFTSEELEDEWLGFVPAYSSILDEDFDFVPFDWFKSTFNGIPNERIVGVVYNRLENYFTDVYYLGDLKEYKSIMLKRIFNPSEDFTRQERSGEVNR